MKRSEVSPKNKVYFQFSRIVDWNDQNDKIYYRQENTQRLVNKVVENLQLPNKLMNGNKTLNGIISVELEEIVEGLAVLPETELSALFQESLSNGIHKYVLYLGFVVEFKV